MQRFELWRKDNVPRHPHDGRVRVMLRWLLRVHAQPERERLDDVHLLGRFDVLRFGREINARFLQTEQGPRFGLDDSLPSFLFDTTLDPKKRSLLMENEINEQTKIVNDFRTLGASVKTIENEERRLQELQAVYYKYFRRDMIQVSREYVILYLTVHHYCGI